MPQPNIVYIHAHDLGQFCEPMGYDIPAPNLMRLARQGALFRNCHASSPSCAPSRAALDTGQYPHSCGMMGLPTVSLGYRLNDYSQHLAAWLSRQGYETALSGVQHVARAPWAPREEFLPYHHFLNHTPTAQQEFDPSRTIPAAIEFLQEPRKCPFFLSVGLLDPHRNNRDDPRTFIESRPAAEPEDIDRRARYCRPWPHMPDNPITRREMANFKMGVESMDIDVGRLLDVLEHPRLRENTLVIFTTDHGPGICEAKCTLSDRGTQVVLIIRGPLAEGFSGGAFAGGKIIDTLTQQMDLFPTVCELLDAPRPRWLQGKSLLPLATGQAESIHEMIFTEQTYHASAEPRPLRAIRTLRYKYIRSFKADQQRGVDRGPAQQFWEQYGYADLPVPDEQLYDLVFDPHEANNLAGHRRLAPVLADLRKRLDLWMQETQDPLATGTIPLPPASQVD